MITTCTTCGKCYEAGSEEQANEPTRFCPACKPKPAEVPPQSRRVLQAPPLKINTVLYANGRIPPRIRLEQRLVWNLLADLADAGFLPEAVLSDDEVETKTAIEVMEEVFNLDEARVFFTGGNWVFLVFGNDGWDAVSDWGWKQDEQGKRFNAVMDAFDGEAFA